MTYTVNDRPATAPRVQPTSVAGRGAAGSVGAGSMGAGPVVTGTAIPATDHRSTAELVKLAAEQVSTLVRDELKLAQVELAQKGKRAGLGVGMFGGAGLFALYGVAALLASVIIALAAVIPAWLSALLVGVVLLVVAGVLALLGKSQVSKAGPPVPQDAVASVKADIDTITHSVKDRGHR